MRIKIQHGDCSSSMLAELFLYSFENNLKNNRKKLCTHINDNIITSTENPTFRISNKLQIT